MNQNKFVFAQIISFLDNNKFYRIVQKYNEDKGVREFSCWNQLLMMLFGQIPNRDSITDLTTVIEAHKSSAYHLGFGKSIHQTTLTRANIKRSYKIFEEFALYMIDYAKRVRVDVDFDVKVDGNIYAFDSSTISLCLNLFWWASYKRQKGGVKIHTLLDVRTQIPCFMLVTSASINDMKVMEYIPYESGSYYIFDRGYNSFGDLYNIHRKGAFFVFRARDNIKFKRMYSNKVDKNLGVMTDQIGVFYVGKSPILYPEKLRKIRYKDTETNREFIFLTNNLSLTASEIALLYKNRWQIELFFKWLKQHLKIKTFWGYTENAVKIQLFSAVIAYCLVAIIAKELKSDRTIYEILQILSISLLSKIPVKELLTNMNSRNSNEPNPNILIFN